jgi:hypothetical protein
MFNNLNGLGNEQFCKARDKISEIVIDSKNSLALFLVQSVLAELAVWPPGVSTDRNEVIS